MLRRWGVLAAVVLLTSDATHAQTLSFSRADYATSPGPRGIAAADFNRDGAMDLVLVNTGRDSLSILMNRTGAGRGFVQEHDIVLGGGPFDVAAADLNGDRVVDLAVANADLNTIDVILGKTEGGFEPPVHIPAPGNPRGLAVADVNGDSKLDLIYTQYQLNRVQVLDGDGAGKFVARLAPMSTGLRPQGVAVGRFEDCCGVGIVVATTGVSGLTFYRRVAADAFSRVDLYGEYPANVLATGDFNRDGRTDVAAASSAANRLSLYHAISDRGLEFRGAFPVGSSPRGIEAADLNNDGWLDLVTADRGASRLTLLFGRTDSTGWFMGQTTIAAGNGSRGVALADYNGDGQLDIATANEFGNSATVLTNSARPPASVFWEARALSSTQFGSFVDVADFNRNGRPDILRNGGVLLDGTTNVQMMKGGTPALSWMGAAGDFNGDAHADVILITTVQGGFPPRYGFDLFAGNGAGGFQHAGMFGSFDHVYQVQVADVNSDARQDLIVAEGSSSGSGGRIHVLLGSASGLVVHNAVSASAAPETVAVDDVNRDGKADIVAGLGFGGPGVQVFTGDGTGAFAAGQFLSAPPVIVHLSDLNHDGTLDIVGTGAPDTLVWLGAGDGTFGAPLQSGGRTFAAVLADFTGDGHVDALGGGDDGAEFLRGIGDGTFADPEPVNARFFDAEAVDYDGDGRMDVVLVNHWHTMVLYNRAARGPNIAPVADAGPDMAYGYERPFDDTECDDGGPSYDPNLDRLTFEWLDGNGRIFRQQPTLCLPQLDPGTHTFTLVVRDPFGGEARDTMTITVSPFKESVFYAAWSGSPSGAWWYANDATAASGQRLGHPNAGAAKIATALPAPTNYFVASFLADPTQTYKMWVRLKAENNSWANDSIFIQFEHGAVVANGQTRYRAGTTDALDVNLEQCSGCGLSGWGWRDERWGSALNAAPVLLRFPNGGLQQIVVQTREDGVSVDQVVFSSEKYLNAPPGPAKNDTTILQPKPW